MSFDKTISMFLFEGNPNGRIMCELSNWNGRAYKISRKELHLFAERNDAKNTGVYFLFGKDEEFNNTIYIGEAEKIYDRIKQHVNDTEYWTDCIVLISKDNHLNKAHVKYLENKFYTTAKEVNRFKILNSTIPTLSSISEYDVAMLNEYFSIAKLLVNTLGYKVFEALTTKNRSIDDYFILKSSRGADAKGNIVADGFVVFKESTITDSTTPSMSQSLIKLRDKLLQDGVINKEYKFEQDYLFTSPSLAAAIVLGRNANGRIVCKI